MHKETLWLMLAGAMLMSATLILSHFTIVPAGVDLSLKLLGVSLMIAALFLKNRTKRT